MDDNAAQEVLYDFGYNCYHREEFSKAEHIFRYLTICNPEEFRFWLALGLTSLCQQEYEKAYNCLSVAETKKESDVRALIYKAECLIGLNQQKAAYEEMQKLKFISEKEKSSFVQEIERVQEKVQRLVW